MPRLRSFAQQSPALVLSVAALAAALSGGVVATATASTTPAPASTVSFTALHLINGWTSQFTTIPQGKPAFGINGTGVVYLSGDLSRSHGSNGTFAYLPRSVRPAHQLDLTVTTAQGTSATMQITATGAMFVFGTNAPAFTSLDGISYPLQG